MKRGSRAPAHRLVGLLVAFLALSPALVVAAPSAQAYTPSAAARAAYEARVLHRINVERARHHHARLAAARCPDRYAEPWASHLARMGYLKHQSMFRILRGCRARVAAENLASGNVSADRIVAMWMASPGHRANILDRRLTKIGVAAVYSRGRWFVAADFTRP